MNERIVCLDIGDVRIGVAVSDPTGTIASPVEVIKRVGWGPDTRKIREICDRYQTNRILSGLPLNMDGTEGFQAEKVRAFCAQLEKAGLSCKRKDDGIVVKQGDFIMKAKLWDNGSHGLKRVHFMFNFAPNVINDVLPEGWALLAAECNANFDHTMVKFYGDHFSCMVETSVKSAKDFLEEYRFAFDKINETMQGMQANADRVASQFPVKKKQIGFVIPEHQ